MRKLLSSAGVQIISGMAYGIDSEAHKGALEGKCQHMQFLQVVWMYAIPEIKETCMNVSYGKMEESSVNSHRVPDQYPGISLRKQPNYQRISDAGPRS